MRAALRPAWLTQRGLAWALLGSACSLVACSERSSPQGSPAPVAKAEPPAAEPPEPPPVCVFDPVSRGEGGAEQMSDQCQSIAPNETYQAQFEAALDSGPDSDEFDPACPATMVLIEGDYCPKVQHTCKRYLDTGFLARHRCAEFGPPKCLSKERQYMRFCIDRDEYTGPPAPDAGPAESEQALPLVEQSWTMARNTCQSLGKRLCFEAEWEFACEGEAMLPYPYGMNRDATLCNFDQTNLEEKGKLRDLRRPAAELKECTSPFGVRNLVGNADEWAQRDGQHTPWRSSLRGGWWLAGRNNCRAATTGHDEYYHGAQTGFRCCGAAR